MLLSARFAADLAALGVAADARLGIAVSGGADSLALLLLAHHAGSVLAAATVDHGLRASSTAEARFVADLCEQRGIAHTTLTLDPHERGNIQDWARRARYAALEAWAEADGLDHILTAHHADDQLETLIMRLNRSSGVGGLAGIRPRIGRLVRPLLGWRKHELEAVVEAHDLVPVDDPSNRDHRYDRARLRDALAEADWIDPVAVARSAALLSEADAALDWIVDTGWAALDAGQPVRLKWRDTPAELRRRHVARAIRAFNPEASLRGEALRRVIASLEAGRPASIAGVRCEVAGDRWVFSPAPPRRPTRPRAEPAAN